MRLFRRILMGLALATPTISCVSYSSIQKVDKEVYLSGGTSYFIMTVPFLKRCDVEGQILRCEELKEFEPSARRGAEPASTGGAAAPASTGAAPSAEKKPPAK